MSASEVAQFLENIIITPDPTVRLQAETTLKKLSNDNFLQFAGLLSQILADGSVRLEARILAGLTLKNELISKNTTKAQQFAQRWTAQIDAESRHHIKQFALQALVDPETRVANTAAQLIAAIAEIELPQNQWPELMKIMVDNTAQEQPENVKRASLLALGYICESADQSDDALINQSNNILIAIVQGAQSNEPSKIVRLTALNALADSLAFIKNNMEREGERNYLMQVVCEATQASDEDIQAAAFGCLCKIMSLYYFYMKPYMEQALFALTVATIQSSNEKVAAMAVEFWSTICEEEIDIAFELSQFSNPGLESYNFALVSIQEVVPTLLQLLTKQNEDPDDDDWNVAMSAGACLQLFAQNCGNYVVEPVLHFVEQNITSNNWRQREAAVMAFGSILDGPDKNQLTSLVHQALPPILNLITDPVLQVKETVAWCMGRIADSVVAAIDPQDHLSDVVNACLIGLKDHAKVATNCSWTIINLVEQLADSPSSPIYNYYPVLVSALLEASNRTDNEHNARASIFSALTALVEFANDQVGETTTSISTFVLDKLGQTMQVDEAQLTAEDRQNLHELQSNILSVLAAVIRKNPQSVNPVADMLMDLFMKLLSKSDTTYVEDDVFYAISALTSALGKNFQKYLESFSPYLVNALNQVQSQVSITAVNLIADISNSLEDDFKKFAPSFMNVLGQMLSSPDAKKELQPAVLSVFGDIATNIGPDFIQYLSQVMSVCVIAQNYKPNYSSSDALDYQYKLYESILDAYVGIITGLHDQPDALFPYTGSIFQFINLLADNPSVALEDSIARTAVGIVGDIAAMYPDGRLKQLYTQPWMTKFVKDVKSNQSFSQNTRDTARWAREQQKLQSNM